MAEEHRRVEARRSVVGTGMATEPDRIDSIARDAARRERAVPPIEAFGAVLARSGAEGELVDDDSGHAAPAAKPRPPPPARPIDPRMRQAHAALDSQLRRR
jgi:hypothetical protein